LELGFRPTTNIRYLSVSSYPNQQSADSMVYDPLRLNSRPLDSASFQTGEAIWWDTLIDGLTAWLVGE
jgi:hypothetical protein